MDYIVRISCPVKGHEDDWIDIDTSHWTMADFDDVSGGVAYSTVMRRLRADAIDWHLIGDNGLVKFPGVGCDDDTWRNAMSRLGLELVPWLAQVVADALLEAITIRSKSAGDNAGSGDGAKDDSPD